MKSRATLTWSLAAALSAIGSLAIGPVGAAVVLEFEESRSSGGTVTKQIAWLESDRLRLDSPGEKVIYRADKKILWTVNGRQKSYTEMSKEDMTRLRTRMEGLMVHMQEQLKHLPPEQRAAMEKALAGRKPSHAASGPGSGLKLTKTGKTRVIEGFPCSSYDMTHQGARIEELWITDWKNVGIEAGDFKVFRSFSSFVGELTQALAGAIELALAQTFGWDLPGVPIRIVSFESDGESVLELKKASRRPIPPSSFELPPGLEKESLDVPQGGGMEIEDEAEGAEPDDATEDD